MDFETALRGMEDAKTQLRSKQGIEVPAHMSEHMDRLAVYTNAVEDQLAELEKELEISESAAYRQAARDNSASASEKIARDAVAEQKAEIKMLSRKVSSAWRLIDEKRSRFNHLIREAQGQI